MNEDTEKAKFMKHYEEVIVPREIERGWHTPEGGEIEPEEFKVRYGISPDLPADAKIYSMQRTKEGYEVKYRFPSPPPKTITETFWQEMTKPRITRYEDYGEKKVLGSPIGGTYATQVLGFPIMLGEATVGELEEHILGKPTPRSELMTPEQIILSYGLIVGAAAAAKIAPKIWTRIKRRQEIPSQISWEQPKIAKYIVSKRSRVSFEFWQQIVETPLLTEMTKPSRQFKPLMFRGKPTTPFALTLAKALMKDTRARAPAVLPKLMLKPKPSPLMARAFPIRVAAPTRISMAEVMLGVSPFIAEGLRQRVIPAVATAQLQVQKQMVTSLSRQMLRTRQVQEQMVTPLSKQMLRTRQKQMLMVTPLSRQILQRQRIIPAARRFPRRIKRRKKVLVESPFARYFFKRHPIPTGSQVMRHILGRK